MRSNIVIVLAIVAGIGLAWVAFAPQPEALPDLQIGRASCRERG